MALKRPTGEALAQEISARVGYIFKDLRLLETALTHSSAVKATTNNERLEFLGDRVLGLIVADMLLQLFPEAREGEIAPRFNALVDARTCSNIGLQLELDQFMRADAALKSRTRKAGGNYLADAVEALVAAIYLDGGIEAARAFVHRNWEPLARLAVEKPANPKGELQEWVARSSDARPVYAIQKREGPDHEPVFTVSLQVNGFAPAHGSGSSRRAAEEAAASEFLVREGVWTVEKGAA
ncbi:ribonuclease III [Mesorhizobium sp. VNQ89]|uniref:ribonuclease III n=1 Tax=Mesorhizobium quangtriensis TaxID=3157709 RepID=UPI0032B8759C